MTEPREPQPGQSRPREHAGTPAADAEPDDALQTRIAAEVDGAGAGEVHGTEAPPADGTGTDGPAGA